MKNQDEIRPLQLGRLDTTVGYLLRRAYRRCRDRVLPVLEQFGFKEIEYTTLIVVIENPDCSLTNIAHAVAVDLPVAHRHVARLQKLGYITKSRSGKDRRVTTYRVTEKGRQIDAAMREATDTADNGLYRHLDTAEHAAFIRYLHTIIGS